MGGLLDGARAAEIVEVGGGKPRTGCIDLDTVRFQVGGESNRDGIGAVVKLTTSKGSQWATVTTASSYLSSGDKRVHFGLGADARVLFFR